MADEQEGGGQDDLDGGDSSFHRISPLRLRFRDHLLLGRIGDPHRLEIVGQRTQSDLFPPLVHLGFVLERIELRRLGLLVVAGVGAVALRHVVVLAAAVEHQGVSDPGQLAGLADRLDHGQILLLQPVARSA